MGYDMASTSTSGSEMAIALRFERKGAAELGGGLMQSVHACMHTAVMRVFGWGEFCAVIEQRSRGV